MMKSKKLKTKKNYFKKSWELLLNSFKEFDNRAIHIVLYDLIFFSISFLSLFLFGRYLQNKSIELNLISIDKLIGMPPEELALFSSQLKGFLMAMIIGFLLVALIVFLSMCIFKALIWFKVAKKKITLNDISKFTLLNLLWFLIWSVLAVVLFWFMKKQLLAPLFIVIALLMMHFTNLLYIFFSDSKGLGAKLGVIKESFKFGIKKFHLFIFPYFIMLVVFLMILQLYWLYSFMPESIQSILTSIILLTYLAWSRMYLYSVVKGMK